METVVVTEMQHIGDDHNGNGHGEAAVVA